MRQVMMQFGALLFCLVTSPVYGQVSPLKVEIRSTRTTVKNHRDFFISAAVINSGTAVWQLWIGCGFLDNWYSDNPSILVTGEACAKTVPIGLKLAPGKAYERVISVHVKSLSGKPQPESLSFRLGFKDPNLGKSPANLPIWSNIVTVRVAP